MIAIATISAQPTCTDGIAEYWSAASTPWPQVYTDWPYSNAVSTRPVPGSIRGGATGMSCTSRLAAVNSTTSVLIRG
jgi:hypothetical protein